MSTAALHAQSRDTAILASVRAIVREVLHAKGFAVAAPVNAEFRTAETGTTGVAVTVRLEDPADADSAAAVLCDRFGGPGSPDAITVR